MKDLAERTAEYERLAALLPQAREELQRYPGVVCVSIGLRERGGAVIGDMVFRVHVTHKRPRSELPSGDQLPAAVCGVPVDVITRRHPVNEVGFSDENDEKKYRPLCGGISISAEDADANVPGTLGCICRRTTDQKVVVLSNWHVLIRPDGAVGKTAGQPKYRTSCCCVCDEIGEILDFDQTLDCAIASVNPKLGWAPKIRRITRPDGTVEEEGLIKDSGFPIPGDEVYKVGMRTGLTRGMITDADQDLDRVEVSPMFAFTRMSNGGDSGSVYVSSITGSVVALHFGGDGTRGYGKPFNKVKARLNIDVIPTPAQTYYPVAATAEDTIALRSPHDALQERLACTEGGRLLLGLMHRHRDEVMALINHRRQVTVTWHRVQGPAYLAALARSAGDPTYAVPRAIDGVSRGDAARYLRDAIAAHASAELAADVRAFGDALAEAFAASDSVDGLGQRWDAGLAADRHALPR